MEYFYCDASAIISLFKENKLEALSQYKDIFHIADLQLKYELLYPEGIKNATINSITVDETTIDLLEAVIPIKQQHKSLSNFDALALVFCIKKNYCLVTNDIRLQKATTHYGVACVTKEYIDDLFINKRG